MDDAVDRLGGACIVRTIQVHRPVHRRDRLAADRTNLTGHVIGHGICRTFFLLDHGNLRDDITGLMQHNGIADTEMFTDSPVWHRNPVLSIGAMTLDETFPFFTGRK